VSVRRADRAGWLSGAGLAVLSVVLWSASCGADAAGRLRVVSLAPNLTELTYAAGAGDTLVGTVEYSDYPAAARSLPRVGDAWRVDAERVLALRPDLVLAWASGTPAETVSRLQSLGVRVVPVATFRLDDVPAALRQIGRMAGTAAVAEVAAVRFERDMRRLRGTHVHARPLTVFIEIDDEPLFTVNGRHIISEVVELCGGRNVFADLPQLAPPVGIEAVLARDPQVILSTDDTIADPKVLWRRWPSLAAVRSDAIYSMDSDTLTRATPRLAQGARAVCDALDAARK
jgi:iron complex transport system substrate-binding protein